MSNRPTENPVLSLALLRATLDTVADGIVVTGQDSGVLEYNRRFAAIWQLPAETMATRNFRQYLHACGQRFQNPKPFLARAEEILMSDLPETVDVLELADGRVIEQVSRIQEFEERSAGRVWSFRDITDRLRWEEGRSRLAAIVESSDDAIVGKTLQGVITNWNRAAERMFGYTADEIVGKNISTLLPIERLDEEPAIIERLKRGERIDHYETVRQRKDGTQFNVSLTVSPIKDSTGRVIGASKIARDITGRIRAETALREETRLLEVLNRAGKAIASQLDLHSLLQLVADAATQLSGAAFGVLLYHSQPASGSFMPRYAFSGVASANVPAVKDWLRPQWLDTVFETRHPLRCDELPKAGVPPLPSPLPPGMGKVSSCLVVPVISRSGEVLGCVFLGHSQAGVFSERTERLIVGLAAQAAIGIDNAQLYEDVKRAAEERTQLLDAERAARAEADRLNLLKDEFLANLSHELRTPLNAILGWSQLLTMGGASPDELRQGIEVIERNARAQTQLIEDLLDMNRIIFGKVRLDMQPVQPGQVVAAAIDTLLPSMEAKGISLRKAVDEQAGPILVDVNRMQQVVWNLLSNAVKFTPQGGRIEVRVHRLDGHVEIQVKDSGRGVSPAFLPYMFERFRQADSSTTRRFGGLGLGLAIVRQLVEMHGGTVRAESAGENLGATFIVRLPLAPGARKDASDARLPHTSQTLDCDKVHLADVRVLVIDDEQDARELVRRVLVHCKAEVVVASSAEEGLRLLESERPHLLVSDIGMPDVDGYTLIRRIRELPRANGGDIPAIALTAFARPNDRERAMLAGYHAHLSKPVQPHELLATVARFVTPSTWQS